MDLNPWLLLSLLVYGLQKDDKAFVKYNESTPPTGNYDDNTVSGNENISNDSKARYKPDIKTFT